MAAFFGVLVGAFVGCVHSGCGSWAIMAIMVR